MTHVPHSPEQRVTAINIGDPQEWIDLYTEQAELDASLSAAMKVGSAAMEAANTMSAGLNLEKSLAEDSSDLSELLSVGDETASVVQQLVRAQSKVVEAYQKVGTIYGQVGFKEWELGSELESIPPAAYVTRGIGEPSTVVSKRYRQTRAEIEIFRQLTGESRPGVTLGLGNDESWSQNHLENFVLNIQRLQMAQIILSEHPVVAAEQFGKSAVIERLGLPPKVALADMETILDKGEEGSWFNTALKVCAEIEPSDQGLTIDRIDL